MDKDQEEKIKCIRDLERKYPEIKEAYPNYFDDLYMTARDVHLGLDDVFTFSCKRCGSCCCTSGAIQLGLSDIKQLREHLNISVESFKNIYLDVKPLKVNGFIDESISIFELKKRDNACILYDKHLKGCSVYTARPIACRRFPVFQKGDNQQTWGLTDKLIHDCLGLGTGQVQTVREWLTGNNAE